MKVLVLADIHGNLNALQAVLSSSLKYNWKELWFLGDLGGYGPEPEECFKLLKTYKTSFISGNHDLFLADRMSGNFFSNEAFRSLALSRSLVSDEFLEYLHDLPEKKIRKGVTLVHGSPIGPSNDYILGNNDALRNFSHFRGFCCLFGHTHIQKYYLLTPQGLKSGNPESGDMVNFDQNRILVNPGSVGQPRDGDPRAGWCIFDTGKKEIFFHRTEYDINETQQKMREIGSSDFLVNRLEKGI